MYVLRLITGCALVGLTVAACLDGFDSVAVAETEPLLGRGVQQSGCAGDCDGDGRIAAHELVIGVRIALDNATVDACSSIDANGDERVSIDELVAAVDSAVRGCPLSAIVLERFDVGEGEVRHVAGGIEIVAELGAEIAGTVIVDEPPPGARTRDFLLTVESGDLVVDGEITFASLESEADGARAPPDLGGGAQGINGGRAPDGGGCRLTVRSGDVILNQGSRFRTEPGRDGVSPAPIVGPGPGGLATGQDGGHGGVVEIACSANLTIESRTPDDPLFVFGDGGNGAPVRVSRSFMSEGVAVLEFVGGFGGSGGRVVVRAASTQGSCSVRGDGLSQEIQAGGKGGRGGEVVWDNTEDGFLTDEPPIDTRFPDLVKILLQGGNGGDGSIRGGDGGSALYASGRAILPVGGGVAFNEVVGGDGGNVFDSFLGVIRGARGGDGGGFYVIGDDGWDAGEDEDGTLERDGGNASVVMGTGGNGGDVPDDEDLLPEGRGGDGGNTLTQVVNFEILSNVITGERRSLGPAFMSVSRGGRGYDGCPENSPGGDGGDFLNIQLVGGAGGDGSVQGGRGGNLNTIIRGRPGEGGAGNPPGECGEPGDPLIQPEIVEPGTGGAGPTPGPDGIVLSEIGSGECPEAPECDCPEGGGAGTGGQCMAPTPTPSPEPPPCTSFSAFQQISVDGKLQTLKQTSGFFQGQLWMIQTVSVRCGDECMVDEGSSTQEQFPSMFGELFFGIQCRGPKLIFPDGVLDTNVSVNPLTGTTTVVERACDCCTRRDGTTRDDWTCCEIAPETFRPCRVEQQ